MLKRKPIMRLTLSLVALMAVSLPLSGAHAEVTRQPGPPQSPILASVTLPAGTTLVLLSGQVPSPLDASKPADDPLAYGDTKTQATGVFRKIDALLAQQGLSLKDVVKLTVFLVGDPKLGGKLDFKGFSEAYGQFFGTTEQPHKVARSVVQVSALANPAFLVEIEAIAAK
jgi:enamine deaminase RidA (YjgF/YER057c/UK114 family)